MTHSLAKQSSKSLKKYNPAVGLKTVAVAEVAEKHFRRAKDAEKLIQAVTLKLTEQRNFVLWWDGQGLSKTTPNRSVRSLPRAGRAGIPDSMTLSRWRKKLATDAAFKDALASATARCLEICEMEKFSHVTNATGYYEWYTPPEIIEAARKVMGDIDIDPATHVEAQKVIKAKVYFTAETNGLEQEWHGRVWMNPPYSQPLIEEFCAKLVKELSEDRAIEAITLTNNATETAWGQMLLNASSALCFPSGRVEFWGHAKGSVPLQGQMICYMGSTHIKEFKQHFSQFGVTR